MCPYLDLDKLLQSLKGCLTHTHWDCVLLLASLILVREGALLCSFSKQENVCVYKSFVPFWFFTLGWYVPVKKLILHVCVKEKALESLCVHFAASVSLVRLNFGCPFLQRTVEGTIETNFFCCGGADIRIPGKTLGIKHLSSTFSNIQQNPRADLMQCHVGCLWRSWYTMWIWGLKVSFSPC